MIEATPYICRDLLNHCFTVGPYLSGPWPGFPLPLAGFRPKTVSTGLRANGTYPASATLNATAFCVLPQQFAGALPKSRFSILQIVFGPAVGGTVCRKRLGTVLTIYRHIVSFRFA